MARNKTFDGRRFVRRTASAALIVAIGLALVGGCKQLCRMEDNQLELHRTMEANAKQTVSGLDRIEGNQSSLHRAIEDVQAETRTGATNLTALKQGQARLHMAIAEVQTSTKQGASEVAGARQEQKRFQAALSQALLKDRQDLAGNIAALEQGQQRLQKGIEGVQGRIQQVASGTDNLQKSVSAMQETLQSGTENMVNIIDVVGQKQLRFEEKILMDIRAVADVVAAIEQRQAKMQNQVGDVQSNTQAMRESMIAVLKQLRNELSRISSEVGSVTGEETTPPAEVEE